MIKNWISDSTGLGLDFYEFLQLLQNRSKDPVHGLWPNFSKNGYEIINIMCLITRLVNGLSAEKVRWGESVERMKKEEILLPGDVLLTAAYLSYVGCFGRNYRLSLMDDKWLPFLQKLDVS